MFSPQEVNSAGRIVATFDGETLDDLRHAYDVMDNWRASHALPLNAFYMTLKNRAERVNSKAISAQRIKRLESIAYKLIHNNKMKLTQMQDIGGCRAVLPFVKAVYEDLQR